MARHTAQDLQFALDAVKARGTIRDAAENTGKTYHWMRERYNTAKDAVTAHSIATTPTDGGLSALLAGLVASQQQQGALLAKLLGNSNPITVAPSPAKPAKKFRKAAVEDDEEAPPEKPIAGGTLDLPETRIRRATGTGFVLTSAQNNTYVHSKFLASLLNFCEINDAQLMVGAFAYNKNGFAQPHRTTKHDTSLWYDDAVQPYIVNEPVRLADDLIWCGNLDISPTAVDPLSGFDSYTQASSGIVPTTKVMLKPLPVMQGDNPRFMYATGTVTQSNYIARKAGQKAEFHHTYAALFVEIDADGKWFARQLISDDSGVFQDLTTVYTPTGTRDARLAGLICGDIHIEKTQPAIRASIWEGVTSIRGTLRPEKQVYHDVPHFYCRSHHNIRDSHFTAERAFRGEDSVEAELQQSADFLFARDGEDDSLKYVVPANHGDHPLKWLKDPAGQFDTKNSVYWHYLNYQTLKAARDAADAGRSNTFDLFEFAVRDKVTLTKTHFLHRDESLRIAGIECGLHGDQGANGSRASIKGFARLGVKTVTGHSHSAWIWEGSWSVGAIELLQGYNQGPSSWSVSHVGIYESGKRVMITQRGTRWRATNRKIHGVVSKFRYRVAAPSQVAA